MRATKFPRTIINYIREHRHTRSSLLDSTFQMDFATGLVTPLRRELVIYSPVGRTNASSPLSPLFFSLSHWQFVRRFTLHQGSSNYSSLSVSLSFSLFDSLVRCGVQVIVFISNVRWFQRFTIFPVKLIGFPVSWISGASGRIDLCQLNVNIVLCEVMGHMKMYETRIIGKS